MKNEFTVENKRSVLNIDFIIKGVEGVYSYDPVSTLFENKLKGSFSSYTLGEMWKFFLSGTAFEHLGDEEPEVEPSKAWREPTEKERADTAERI